MATTAPGFTDILAPDALSRLAAQRLSPDRARRLKANVPLRVCCEQHHIDLDALICTLRMRAEERLRSIDHAHEFVAILDELAARSIRYVLIGGLAGRIYGSNHATGDFDICHARDGANLDALARLLREVHAEFRRLPQFAPAELDAATFATETDFVFTTTLGKLDLIGAFTGVGMYAEAVADAIEIPLAGHQVKVLSLPKLLAAKQSTGRSKDLLVHGELQVVTQVMKGVFDE